MKFIRTRVWPSLDVKMSPLANLTWIKGRKEEEKIDRRTDERKEGRNTFFARPCFRTRT
jgi:hypothetical protein